jgi:hypothetical protein
MNSLAIPRFSVPGHPTASTPCVLAIEPDASQALILEQALSGRIAGKLVVVKSTEAALKSLVDTIPDLVLVSPLLSPRTEDQFVTHLRALGVDASHLQLLSIPRFGDSQAPVEKKWLFGAQSSRKPSGAGASCDPVAFADEVVGYLTQVSDERHDGRTILSKVDAPPPEPSDDTLAGVRIEHIERLLERLQADSTSSEKTAERADNSSPQRVGEAISSEAIPERDVMAMQSTQEVHGSATREPNSARLPRFLTLDEQISSPLRALLGEADGCLRMSFLTGGGACAGRALDLLLSEQGIVAGDRSHQIQELGKKHPAVAESFLRVLSQVVNDPSGAWDVTRLTLAIAILKAIAYEIYVLGPERTERATYVIGLLERFNSASKGGGSTA